MPESPVSPHRANPVAPGEKESGLTLKLQKPEEQSPIEDPHASPVEDVEGEGISRVNVPVLLRVGGC
jgi:hypothetical protein